MGRSNALILALAMVGLASTTTAGIVAVAWRNRTAVPAQPVARLPGKGKPAPVAPGAAAPFSTARANPVAEKVPESEAELAAKIIANRWWKKPPTAPELARFVDWMVGQNRFTRVYVNQDFKYEARSFDPAIIQYLDQFGSPLEGLSLTVTLIEEARPTRIDGLRKLARSLAAVEYESGPAR